MESTTYQTASAATEVSAKIAPSATYESRQNDPWHMVERIEEMRERPKPGGLFSRAKIDREIVKLFIDNARHRHRNNQTVLDATFSSYLRQKEVQDKIVEQALNGEYERQGTHIREHLDSQEIESRFKVNSVLMGHIYEMERTLHEKVATFDMRFEQLEATCKRPRSKEHLDRQEELLYKSVENLLSKIYGLIDKYI